MAQGIPMTPESQAEREEWEGVRILPGCFHPSACENTKDGCKRCEREQKTWPKTDREVWELGYEEGARAALAAHPASDAVNFYEREFYPLSNFSAFRVWWAHRLFNTSEQAYHWEKFPDHPNIQNAILHASSAHDSFKLAEAGKRFRRENWDSIKVEIMRNILRAKVDQHEYVRRKLLETGERQLIEMSWRDDYWGWGPNRDGQNMLGKLWMEIRAELLAAAPVPGATS